MLRVSASKGAWGLRPREAHSLVESKLVSTWRNQQRSFHQRSAPSPLFNQPLLSSWPSKAGKDVFRQRNHSTTVLAGSSKLTRPMCHLSIRRSSQSLRSSAAVLSQYYLNFNYLCQSFQRYSNPRMSHDTTKSFMLAASTADVSTLGTFADWLLDLMSRFWDLILISIRTTEVALRVSPLIVLTPAAILYSQCVASNSRGSEPTFISKLAWRYTISAVQGLGPVAVKLCQWIATRRDIFPPNICDHLSQLHDDGYPHSWSYTHSVLTDAFGDYEAKGLTIQKVIGCGSAAQVYEGTLRVPTSINIDDADGETAYTEKRVAIKVLHPRFRELVDKDLAFITAVAKLLHSLPSDLIKLVNLPRVAENFEGILRLQADLTVEATNLVQFRNNFYGETGKPTLINSHTMNDSDSDETTSSTSAIVFPRPISEWTRPRVLVESLVENAAPIASYLHDTSHGADVVRRQLAGPLLRAFLKMVFMDNFIHGDLHPGNVLVQKAVVHKAPPTNIFGRFFTGVSPSSHIDKSPSQPTTETKYSIVFLDAGISTSLSPNDQRNLADLFRAVIFNDGHRAGRLMVERAKYERCSQVPGGVEKFADGIQGIVSEFHDRRRGDGLTLGTMQIGSLLSRVLDLCRIHGVEIDPAMSSVVVSTLVLEGLGRSLEPNLNLLDVAKPFILGMGRV